MDHASKGIGEAITVLALSFQACMAAASAFIQLQMLGIELRRAAADHCHLTADSNIIMPPACYNASWLLGCFLLH